MKLLFFLFLLFTNCCFSQVNLQLGLRAYYPFSGNAKDESGNNNHPIYNSATLTADRFGNPKSAYHFDGVRSYMKILNSASINTSNKLSLCAWVKPQGFYSGKCHGNSILMKGDADYLRGNYLLRFDDNPYSNGNNCYSIVDKAHQNFYGVGAISSSPGYTPYIKPNQWYSVVVTNDGKTSKLYVDCKLIVSRPQKDATFTNMYDLYLGRLNHSDFPYWFKGDLDEVRIYDRALNQQEIMALCDKQPDIKSPPEVKPEFVKQKTKEKKKEDVVKQKHAEKPQNAKETNPLMTINNPADLDPGIIKPMDFETQKEIVLEKRNKDLIREIIVENDSISITLYDNGIVDGDSITLVYNDKILTTHQLLTEKPLTFFIRIDKSLIQNELVMYAENLGSIPPNTALMVIYDGNKRYELNVSSSKTSNGVVSFKLKE